MVRLRDKSVDDTIYEVANFNSSMVRLRGISFPDGLLPILISIPVWCD